MWVVDFSPSLQRCWDSITHTTPDSSSYITIAKDQLVIVLTLCSRMNFSSPSLSLPYWASQAKILALERNSMFICRFPTWYLLRKDEDSGILILPMLSKARRNRRACLFIKRSGKKFWEINTSASITQAAKVRVMHGDTVDVFWNEIW